MQVVNLKIPEHSYFFGFVQTDGHLKSNTRNRGCLSIEIKQTDCDIIEKFQSLFSVKSFISTRTRNTNYKENYSSVVFNVFDLDFRTQLNELGIPYGKKSSIIKPPNCYFCEVDYWRGIIDGDGSLGITKTGKPFISLITTSDILAERFELFCSKITSNRKILNRNKRDNVYNICYTNEDAKCIVAKLYYDNCLSLHRKYLKSQDVLNWERDPKIKKIDFPRKNWNKEEDEFILSHNIQESIKTLGRTEQSIKTRLYRINN